MKKISLMFASVALIILSPLIGQSQGLNNNYDYAREDLNMLFTQMGFSTFKFPIKQDTTQLCDFIIEEFINGKAVSKKTLVSLAKEKFQPYGIDYKKYFKPKKDSIYFHRFYFFKKDTALVVRVKTQGYSTNVKLENANTSLYDLRARWNIKEETDSLGFIQLNGEKDLLFLYANSKDNKEEPLWCPSGLPKKEILKRYYYVAFISTKEYREK